MKTISKETAGRIWSAYNEIEKTKKLISDMEGEMKEGRDPNPQDPFGRRRNLTMGVPCGDNTQRMLDVAPRLALQVMRAHIADKEHDLIQANTAALAEAGAALPQPTSPYEAWYLELINEIYGERPDGGNERPDPRQLIQQERRRASVFIEIANGYGAILQAAGAPMDGDELCEPPVLVEWARNLRAKMDQKDTALRAAMADAHSPGVYEQIEAALGES